MEADRTEERSEADKGAAGARAGAADPFASGAGEMLIHDLTLRIDEARDALAAIRRCEVDALVIATGGRDQVFILKGADNALRALLETLSEGALNVVADGTILYANGRFASMVGIPVDALLGTSLRALVAPADAPAFDALLATAVRGHGRGELTLDGFCGRRVQVMASMSALGEGEHPSCTVVMTDLSPLKAAESALRKANDELEARVAARTDELSRANATLREEISARTRLERELRGKAAELIEADRRKDEFLSMLAHELRNPLAPILFAAETMRGPAAGQPRIERCRAVIDRQTRSLARIVDDLLDVSRITRGNISLQRQGVELSLLVRTAVEGARPLIDSKGHTLAVSLPDRPVCLFVDPTRIEQVLVNVLNNAAKYTDPRGRIDLAAELHGGEVVLRVRDSGVGIPADLLPRIFDIFVQSDRSLDRAQGGLGIGLSLVKSLVEMHGGHVEARSDGSGRGTEIVLRLPVLPEDAGSVAPADGGAALRDAGEDVEAPSIRRVLVVEDNLDAAQTLTELLSLWGHDVAHAACGEDALRIAATFHPEIALVDIGLPGMDGYEVARALRSAAADGAEARGAAPVLIGLTGYGREEDRTRGREAGFDHHLIKPLDPEVLRRLLRCVEIAGGAR
jgi:PAS domain S-box-containing protein